ncbi:MAG: aspartate carbamoyltransferase [Promethearchaeota archaeon]
MDFSGRHIMSIRDFSRDELEHIFKVANEMEKYAKTGSEILKNKILATLFFEPSTRTRLSFTSAMYRLGGKVLGFDDPEMSSYKKGETLVDSIRVIESYADAIVIRHTTEGIVELATEYSNIPIINAGSGTLGHPTQAMLDMFTILREKKTIDGLTIGILGDLKYGRTVKSLSYGLAHYDVKLVFIAPELLKMRKDILEDLVEAGISTREISDLDKVLSDLDVLYVCRIQKERFPDLSEYERVKGGYGVDHQTLKTAKDDLIIMHPLPRVDEISTDVDSTRHAVYFRQSANGVLVRMALLSLIMS